MLCYCINKDETDSIILRVSSWLAKIEINILYYSYEYSNDQTNK